MPHERAAAAVHPRPRRPVPHAARNGRRRPRRLVRRRGGGGHGSGRRVRFGQDDRGPVGHRPARRQRPRVGRKHPPLRAHRRPDRSRRVVRAAVAPPARSVHRPHPARPGNSLNPVATIEWSVAEALRIHGWKDRVKIRARVIDLLERVGIDDPESRARQYPHELSGGMRQRVLIAAALALEPELIIADEPTSALDVTVQRTVLDLLDELRTETGTGILFITHDLAVAADRSDALVVMQAGRVQEAGPTAQVLARRRRPTPARSWPTPPRSRASSSGRRRRPRHPHPWSRSPGSRRSSAAPGVHRWSPSTTCRSRWRAGRRTRWSASRARARPRRDARSRASTTRRAAPSASAAPRSPRSPADVLAARSTAPPSWSTRTPTPHSIRVRASATSSPSRCATSASAAAASGPSGWPITSSWSLSRPRSRRGIRGSFPAGSVSVSPSRAP